MFDFGYVPCFMQKLLKESTSLKDFFGNPSVKKHALQKAVVGMAADLKFQPSTANLLGKSNNNLYGFLYIYSLSMTYH